MDKIKVIVCDDSPLMRLVISDVLNSDSRIEVIATAVDGKDLVDKCKLLKPSVVTIDMEMPKYNGTWAIKEVMGANPLPMLIVSSLGNTNIKAILDALKLGAVDYINKPGKNNTGKIREIDSTLIKKVVAAAHSNIKIKLGSVNVNNNEHTFAKKLPYDLIAIGSSTGGPGALEEVLSNLPSNLPLPVIIAQHMPANFIKSFVERLNIICPLNIVVGKEGMEVKPGTIAILCGEHNSVVDNRGKNRVFIRKIEKKYRHFNYPSVDALFESVAEEFKERSIGVILTGMGKDGGEGLKKMRDRKAFTVGQDEKSCIVYGMPKYASDIGAVDYLVSLKQIGGFIISSLS